MVVDYVYFNSFILSLICSGHYICIFYVKSMIVIMVPRQISEI